MPLSLTRGPGPSMIVASLVTVAGSVACRPTVDTDPPSAPALARASSIDDSEQASSASPPSSKVDAPATTEAPVHRFAWGNTTGDWNSAVAVAPAGWVLSVGRTNLRVHASDDGRVLESTRSCSVADGGAVLFSDTAGAVVCSDGEIRALTLPGLAQRTVGHVGGNRVEVVGWGGALVAIGDRDGRVAVVDTNTWQLVDDFTVPHSIEGVAVDPSGRWVAAGDEEGGTHLRDLGTKATRELIRTDRRPTAMAASPDGTRLFVQDGSFEARVYELRTGAIEAAYDCGSWLTGARWLSPELVAATGSDGFVLYPKGSPKGQALVDPDAERHSSYEWLGASADGAIACGGDRGGRISCFSTRPMPASTYEPAPAVASHTGEPWTGAGSGAVADPSKGAAGPLLQGTIASRKGKVVEVTATGPERPAVGSKGSLSRKFERQIGRMSMSGWMSIAKVEVTKVSGSTVELRILEQTADVKINGRTQNQFEAGFEVKLEPGEP